MKITFLGTGTSTGVPQIGCQCQVCRSTDYHDKRMRTSAVLHTAVGNILMDCGPDFRTQMLSVGQPHIDALFITHSHYDHVGGIDDLRPFCASPKPFPIYCQHDVAQRIRTLMPYSFSKHPYPGAPRLELIEVEAGKSFLFNNALEVTPLRVMHTSDLPILGYKVGQMAYITDSKYVPCETLKALDSLNMLVINALRITEHNSHLNLEQALDIIKTARVSKAYLTHMSHQMGLHSAVSNTLPENVFLAYDGLTLEF